MLARSGIRIGIFPVDGQFALAMPARDFPGWMEEYL